jgi:hypothetical protein
MELEKLTGAYVLIFTARWVHSYLRQRSWLKFDHIRRPESIGEGDFVFTYRTIYQRLSLLLPIASPKQWI